MSMNAVAINSNICLQVSGVTIGYHAFTALTDVSFTVFKGEFIGIIGPNGSGKSTLLKGILGLLPLQTGVIKGNGDANPRSFRQRIGYVSQKSKNELQFPATVEEVVMMGLYVRLGWFRRPGRREREMAYHALEMVGLPGLADRPIARLSGGQHQRVMIARALVAEPELLLLDEPTAAVDIKAQQEILELLEQLNREQGMTILMVTHDINEIVHFCDKVLFLNGKVCGYGPAREVLTRENLKPVYGERLLVYDHDGHPHLVVGDFNV